jgi:lysophospholipase L1-like esterase
VSPGRSRPRARGLARNLALAAASLAACLGLLEAGARLADPAIPLALLPTEGGCIARSALLGIEFAPSCSGAIFTWRMRTNELGLRGAPLRSDGSRRILAVGDSCTFGWAVGEPLSYPVQLERRLARDLPGEHIQVINAGVPGYTSHQGLLYLRERGLALEPELAIVGFGFNDALRVGDIGVALERQRRQLVASRADAFLMGRSVFYRWLRWQGAPAQQELGPRVTPEGYRRNLEEIVGLLQARGVGAVLVDFLTSLDQPGYRSALAAVARERGVPLVGYEGPTFDRIHPTALGYAALARRLAPLVEELLRARGARLTRAAEAPPLLASASRAAGRIPTRPTAR